MQKVTQKFSIFQNFGETNKKATAILVNCNSFLKFNSLYKLKNFNCTVFVHLNFIA